MDLLYTPQEIEVKTGGSHKDIARPITLPSNFFSKLTEQVIDYVPVQETELEDYQPDTLVSTTGPVRPSDEAITMFWQNK